MEESKRKILVAVSGHFNPLHVGHLSMIEEAKKLGDWLCVIIANDKQARAKRPVVFLSEIERKKIMQSLKNVDYVITSVDTDTNVCETLKILKPDIFASGCDESHPDARKEKIVCDELGIATFYNVGGDKINSSSIILKKYVSSL